MRLIKSNWDKPHRCPVCWSIPDKAHKHGRARLFAFYRCTKCNVVFTRLWRE